MLKWINKKRNKKGFTLVELVVVIAILAILAGIAIPRLSRSRLSAQIGAHNANVRTLESVAIMWVADNPEGGLKVEESKDALTKYLQEWPEVAKALVGQKYGEETIKEGAEYQVKISEDGEITVTPGTIEKATDVTDSDTP